MGNVDWNPANLAKNWMNVCKGFQGLPFISQTLWQIGPMPWLMNLTSSSFDWDNGNWGRFDGFDRSDAGKKPQKEPPAAKTPEEKKENAQKLGTDFDKISVLKDNYNKTLRIPMWGNLRSLNLSNSVAITVYEAFRQNGFESLNPEGHLTGRKD